MNVLPKNDKVDSIFKQYLKPGSPGCALSVMKDGEIVYQQGYGYANLEHNVPILPSTVFNIGSTAKQFTAFSIALLEDEGKLSYDDDIREYLPEMHDFGQPITIRHLIHHTSGLRGSFPELLALAEWRDADATTSADVFWLLKAQRELNYPPGEEYMYVNSNYLLMALICERVSGQSFAGFCQERIFDPLGMTHSFINDSIVKMIPGRALGYYEGEDGNWNNAPLTDSVIGPTNVYTTVEDLAKWDENFYTGEIGGRVIIERMEKPGILNDGMEIDYAFGLMVGPAHRHRDWQMIEHGGGQGGYGSWMVRFPELHLSVVVLFNHFLFNMRAYALEVADLFLEDNQTPETRADEGAAPHKADASIKLSPEQLEKWAGTYFNSLRAALRELTIHEGQLQYQGLKLVPLSEKLFYFEEDPETRVEFFPVDDNAVVKMKTMALSGEHGYDRVEISAPTADELTEYSGRYYSPELDIYWRIEVMDGQLTCKRRKYVDSILSPVFTDVFHDDWTPLMDYPASYLIVFERDQQDTISGLRVSGNRVRNLIFIKGE